MGEDIKIIIEACYHEFCQHIGDSPCGCDACPYGDSETCYEEYVEDKMEQLKERKEDAESV